jgi:hypothetical protein
MGVKADPTLNLILEGNWSGQGMFRRFFSNRFYATDTRRETNPTARAREGKAVKTNFKPNFVGDGGDLG